jgi:hypothetical protein
MSSNAELKQYVQARDVAEKGAWAGSVFGHIDNIGHRPTNRGREGLVGEVYFDWDGIAFHVGSIFDGGYYAAGSRLCSSCGSYTPAVGRVLRNIDGLLELLNDQRALDNLRAPEKQCYNCRWLAVAQTEARVAQTKGRLSRWWFEQRRGESVESVLAR